MLPLLFKQRLGSGIAVLQNQQHLAAAVTWSAAAFSAAAQPQLVEDELVSKAAQALEDIKAAGTLKVERQITTPQAASVGKSSSHLTSTWNPTLSIRDLTTRDYLNLYHNLFDPIFMLTQRL